MTFSHVLEGYQGFARRVATGAGARVDAIFGSGGTRRIRTEMSNFVLGAEAIPAPVFGRGGFRR